jgi:hypothetical protein
MWVSSSLELNSRWYHNAVPPITSFLPSFHPSFLHQSFFPPFLPPIIVLQVMTDIIRSFRLKVLERLGEETRLRLQVEREGREPTMLDLLGRHSLYYCTNSKEAGSLSYTDIWRRREIQYPKCCGFLAEDRVQNISHASHHHDNFFKFGIKVIRFTSSKLYFNTSVPVLRTSIPRD